MQSITRWHKKLKKIGISRSCIMFCVVSNFKNQIKANMNNSNGTPKADFTNANGKMQLFQQCFAMAFQQCFDPSSNHSNMVVDSSPSLSRSTTTTSTFSCLAEQKPFETPVRSKNRKQSSLHGSNAVHPHFQMPKATLTIEDFMTRLNDKLSKEVLDLHLESRFSILNAFRNQFIVPLSESVGHDEAVDLKDVKDFPIEDFLRNYQLIFIDGCHVRRETRKKGSNCIPDTKERSMYRDLITDLWVLLGIFLILIVCR